MGLTTLNLPHVALSASGDLDTFWEVLDSRLELVLETLLIRYNRLKGVKSDVAPMLWQGGALARLKPGETIDKLLEGGYATISLGYIGLDETVKILTGESITKQEELAKAILQRLKEYVNAWKAQYNLGFALYGTPSESLTYKMAKANRKAFGVIEGITDRDYITNSFHVNVTEEISAFDKLEFESDFQNISTGGCISYIETPGMYNNIAALRQIVEFIAGHITYAEINGKHDHCSCGFEGEVLLDEDLNWYCPQCGTKDKTKLTVVRRTCGLK